MVARRDGETKEQRDKGYKETEGWEDFPTLYVF
jgi:hypothetical protein